MIAGFAAAGEGLLSLAPGFNYSVQWYHIILHPYELTQVTAQSVTNFFQEADASRIEAMKAWGVQFIGATVEDAMPM